MTKAAKQEFKDNLIFIVVSSRDLFAGSKYLNAGHYCSDGYRYRHMIYNCSFEKKKVSSMADCWMLNRYKRLMVDNSEHGVPFLTASQINEAKPQTDKYLSKKAKELEPSMSDENVILITRSGTIGNSVLVNKTLKKFALSDDLVRVKCYDDIYFGYIYAFLNSKIGKARICSDQFGNVIKHIDPEHIEKIEVPLLPDGIQKKVHNDIIKAYKLRDEANDLLDEADDMLYTELGLPRIDECKVKYYNHKKEADEPLKVFSIKYSELNNRFDASFHVPLVQIIRNKIRKIKHKNLRNLVIDNDGIYMAGRGKRLYVNSKNGVPFYSGKKLMEINPKDISFLANSYNNIKNYLVSEGDIIVSRVGTVGNIAYIYKDKDNHCVSDNTIRLRFNDKVFPSYAYVFLSSQYGQILLKSLEGGNVQQYIAIEYIGNILIPLPNSFSQQTKIGEIALKAFQKRSEANKIENNAVALVEKMIRENFENISGKKK